jgi:two-component system chemotaxis response regulator CheB
VSKQAHDIIVIGASAGGVEALMTLVARLPAGLPASLFIVVHTLPTYSSVLPEILSRLGPLPAFHATEGMMIEQGTIYVAPPDHHLEVSPGSSVHLGTGPKEQHVRPAADVLFRSAARAYGSRVVGVVLTGLGQDGTNGLQAVKQHGGVTVIQDPTEAAWPSMPQSALEHVAVDYIVPLSSLASLLIRLVEPSGSTAMK